MARVRGLKDRVTLRDGVSARGRLKRKTVGAKEARHQLLVPEQLIAAVDPPVERGVEKRDRRCHGRKSTQAMEWNTAARRRTPPSNDGHHQHESSAQEHADANRADWKRFLSRPHCRRE